MTYYKLNPDKSVSPLAKGEYPDFDIEYRRVALDRACRTEVSTVFLGLDHGWGNTQAPILFETMIFSNDRKEFNWFQLRYTTYQDAVIGHGRILAQVKRKLLLKRFINWLFGRKF